MHQNNFVSANDHWKNFKTLTVKCGAIHKDVKMRFFFPILRGWFLWFISFPANSISNEYELHKEFLDIWGENKDMRNIFFYLFETTKNKNETCKISTIDSPKLSIS
jgi:hypothetical protein